ncbi:urease accessory protein [Meinhardsimonia xiamenensis]|jgi:urease accessory protein|uniref:Urease accessory protein UreF n=1 Tax=Meinhardsimonia xiamenensis TaxID=990712 RepID=A0A1G9FIU6_9RHOB|nr:urease accessory UreF family protein [Meinhardsimonia xiamenensis]PRX37824.1 urease accessory protein [Meinhardsimonia xiamenensis]SDK88320.1 urease accessory protein [Meinhardsimonia xiamenensis]
MATATEAAIDGATLLTLTRWLSPAFPTGAFAWSHGLEAEVAAGRVRDGAGLSDWLAGVLAHGAGRNDAILIACAWRAARSGDAAALGELAELAAALAPGAERETEARAQGAAFARTLAAAGEIELAPCPLPVAVGAAAGRAGLPLGPTLLLHLQNFTANLVTIGVRHIPLGQSEGQAILAALAPLMESVADSARKATADDIGGCAIASDIASLEHETLPTRIFRS